MILPTEENTENSDGLVCLVSCEVEYGLVLGHMPEPLHDLGFQSTLERHISETRQIIFDPYEPDSCPVQCDIRRITQLLISIDQVVEDQLEIFVAPNTADDLIDRGHDVSCRSLPLSVGALLRRR